MNATDRYMEEVEEWLDEGQGEMPWLVPEDVDLDRFLERYREMEDGWDEEVPWDAGCD